MPLVVRVGGQIAACRQARQTPLAAQKERGEDHGEV
jgi:hypothetical protein